MLIQPFLFQTPGKRFLCNALLILWIWWICSSSLTFSHHDATYFYQCSPKWSILGILRKLSIFAICGGIYKEVSEAIFIKRNASHLSLNDLFQFKLFHSVSAWYFIIYLFRRICYLPNCNSGNVKYEMDCHVYVSPRGAWVASDRTREGPVKGWVSDRV